MARHNILGKQGEDEAVVFLEKSGYNVLERNWKYNGIEIDIVATNKDFLVFIEVKTRSSLNWGTPEDSVNAQRIKRMVTAADYYVQENNYDLPVRFDIISILSKGNNFEIKHIDDAFWPTLD